MPSLGIKPAPIANFPSAADRSLFLNSYQHHYLSPPLTPFLQPPFFQSEKVEVSRSPPPTFTQSLPGLREMLPQQGREQLSQPDPGAHAYTLSAQQQPHERSIHDPVEHNSVSVPRGLQHSNDPTRILPLYSSSSTSLQTPSIGSPLLRRNKAHVASACVNCKKAHLACDGKYSPISVFVSMFGNSLNPPHGTHFPPYRASSRSGVMPAENINLSVCMSNYFTGAPRLITRVIFHFYIFLSFPFLRLFGV
jgi:hypothetical protein